MKRKIFTLLSLACVLVIGAAMMTTPAAAQDPGPLGGALATIAAVTAQAAQAQSAQRAAAAAQSAEATRQAVNALATARAMSAEATARAMSAEATRQAQSAVATQNAIDELNRQRAMTSTAQAQNAQATQTARLGAAREHALAIEATATAQAMNARATATSQAVAIAAQATDTARLSATYATRQDRFTWGLLAVELVFICGAAWVLWRLALTLAAWADKMRPTTEQPLSGLIAAAAQPSAGSDFGELSRVVVIDQARPPEPRMPSFVTVNNDPRFVEVLNRWAEKYDREHGVYDGDN